MTRIVTLIASATEIVCELGFEKQLVGRSHECDYPPSIVDLPVCTEPRFDVEGTSAEVDQRVKDILADGASVYRVHVDVLEQLKPDVIVTQDQCKVCAVSLDDVKRALQDRLESQPRLVSLLPNSLADVWRDVQTVADALGHPERGDEVVGALQMRISKIAERCNNTDHHPKVVCLEWLDPLMAAGNWMPELVRLAGGVPQLGEDGKHSPWMTWNDLTSCDPDVIIALPCGYDMDKTRQEMKSVTVREEWQSLRAVSHGEVYVTDGNQYFNRPGPRLVESLEILAELLHPALRTEGHEGRGWEKL